MPGKQGLTVRDYLKELRENKKGKPAQIKDALEIYIDLWDAAIDKGIVGEGDDVPTALSKLDRAGGLYEAAGDSSV